MQADTSTGGKNRGFEDTRWSSVARAQGDPQELGRILSRVWKPLYLYLRRKGHDSEASKDLTQAFLTHFVELRLIEKAAVDRGRFRGFLLASLEHFLANEYRKSHAVKRGSGVPPVPMDFEQAERSSAAASEESAQAAYERAWAASLLGEALDRLRREMGERFEVLRAHLAAECERPRYEDIARHLGVTVSDVGNILHRARLRLGEIVLEELRALDVEDPREELGELLRMLRKS